MELSEKAIKQQDVREHNVDIITHLLFAEPLSCVEIANKINISDAAVNKIVKQLLALNIIMQDNALIIERKKGGQHIRYCLNPFVGMYICIDFTHNLDRFIVYDFAGKEILTKELSIPLTINDEKDLDNTIKIIQESIKPLLPQYSNNILSLSMSIPGQVNHDQSVLFSGKFIKFVGKGLYNKFYEAFRCKIFIRNNVHYMALGEYDNNTLVSPYNIATYVYLSYGIASCVLIDGNCVTGWEGYAGEIGGNFVYPNSTISLSCSISRLLKKAETMIGPCDLPRLLEEYKTNPDIHSMIIESAKIIGAFIINSSNLIGCNLFMLGGEFLTFGSEYLNTIIETVTKKAVNHPSIITSSTNRSTFRGMMKEAKDYCMVDYYKKSIFKI